MKILHSEDGRVDLENPVYMEEDQLNDFVTFLKGLLGEQISIQEVNEKERFIKREGGSGNKSWNEDELILLLNTKVAGPELIKKLKRSAMAIDMKRAQFVPEFVSWAKSKGFEANKITRTIIKQFLEEKDEDS